MKSDAQNPETSLSEHCHFELARQSFTRLSFWWVMAGNTEKSRHHNTMND